jgi:hypothetical protein
MELVAPQLIDPFEKFSSGSLAECRHPHEERGIDIEVGVGLPECIADILGKFRKAPALRRDCKRGKAGIGFRSGCY